MKNNLLLLLLTILIASCSSDDDTTSNDNPPMGSEESVIRITEVNSSTDQIVISNLGNGSADIGSYWLCLGPGTYVQVSDAASGSTNLNPNQSITLSYDVNPASDGLSIFTENTFASSDPTVLLDYVQWGAANQARVDQAVTAGRWDNASNFIPEGSPYTFNGGATNFGSTFWDNTVTTGPAIVKISQVNATTDEVTLTNLGETPVDVASYWLCLGPGAYAQVSATTSASTNLNPNDTVVLSFDVNETEDGLSIFTTNSFASSDPNILVDYVQWGAANQPRVGQAVSAGRWDNANNFVPLGSPYIFNGGATDFGSPFWN